MRECKKPEPRQKKKQKKMDKERERENPFSKPTIKKSGGESGKPAPGRIKCESYGLRSLLKNSKSCRGRGTTKSK